MGQLLSSTAERLRQLFAWLSGSSTAALMQIEQDLNTRRRKVDRLVVEGQFTEALLLENENLKDLVKRYGMKDLRTILSIGNVATLSFDCGDYGTGERLLNQVIELRTEVQGKDHSDTLASIASKIGALSSLGRTDDAERLGLDCLNRCEEHLEHSDTATLRAASNLAFIYNAKGNFDMAETMYTKVLDFRRRTLPEDDIDTVRTQVNLSGIYLSQKRWAEASLLLESVLTIRRRTLGDGHALTLNIARGLQDAYEQSQRWKDVQAMQIFILEIMKKTSNVEEDEILDAKVRLALTYMRLEAWSDASMLIQEILMIKKKKPSVYPEIPMLESFLEEILNKIANVETPLPTDAAFIYDSLNLEEHDIRLVYIKKSAAHDPLQARLITVSLEAAPLYEALSYAWGGKENSGVLNLEGHYLKVTNNLEAALLQLRLETQDRLLWVDAICINQEDLEERSEQVRMMRKIYRKATQTLVWLGNSESNSDLGMKFLKDLEGHPAPEDLAFSALESLRDDILYNSLQDLFKKRAYWGRLWIIQEIACSRNVVVYCGNHSVSYATLQTLWKTFTNASLMLDPLEQKRHVKFLDNLVLFGPTHRNEQPESGKEGRPILQLLDAHRNSLCTDLRDKVYGLLGISYQRGSTHPGLKIDYTKSISEVYKGAARAIIEETNCLDVVCMNYEAITRQDTKHYRPRQPFLPTWAPDWNLYRTSWSLSTLYADAEASGDSQARFSFSPDGNVLTAQGLCIAPLSGCSLRLELTNTSYSAKICWLLTWMVNAQTSLGIQVDAVDAQDDPRLDQFYRLLTCANPELERIRPDVKTWLAQWRSHILQRKPSETMEITSYQKVYVQLLFDHWAGKRLLFFENPRGSSPPSYKMGMCPNEAEEGDSLCVLLGCNYPVVLRPWGGHYVLVGGALVLEYMKGEAIDEMRKGTLKTRDFVIH